jgi:hypothetical protein
MLIFTILALLAVDFATAVNVTVWNTFTNTSSGGEYLIDSAGPAIIMDGGLEFPLFPYGSMYDIDVTSHSISMILRNNTVAPTLLFTKGVSDHYYFDLGREVLIAMLDETDSGAELHPFVNVSIIPPGTTFMVASNTDTNTNVPIAILNGGILIELGEGTNITQHGVSLKLEYMAKAVDNNPSPTSAPTATTTNTPTASDAGMMSPLSMLWIFGVLAPALFS